MANVLLDAIYDATEVALRQNNMLEKIMIVKDLANFQMIIKLKNWEKLKLEDEVDSYGDFELRKVHSFDDLEEDILSGHVSASAIIKEEFTDDTVDDIKSEGSVLLAHEPITPPTPLIAPHSQLSEGSRMNERVQSIRLSSYEETLPDPKREIRNLSDPPDNEEEPERLAKKTTFREKITEEKKLEPLKKRAKEKKARARGSVAFVWGRGHVPFIT